MKSSSNDIMLNGFIITITFDSRRRVLSKKRLVDAMKESVSHYSKYRHAGVMETEACIKAVQILIAAGEKLEAADFLQNVVFINLNMNEEEKVLRFATLSKLYAKLGFVRKAAFFHRVAAMRYYYYKNL